MPSISASGRGGQPGTWMSTGNDLVDSLEHGVVVEHPAGARAGAHRDDPLGLEHLVVDLSERRRHLVRHRPETISRSAWRGDEEKRSIPKRAMS